MLPLVAAHARLLRVVPLLVDGGSHEVTLEYLGHGFSLGPWGWWRWGGFYTVMVGLVSYHVVSGRSSDSRDGDCCGELTLAGRVGKVSRREPEEAADHYGDSDRRGWGMAFGIICGCCKVGPSQRIFGEALRPLVQRVLPIDGETGGRVYFTTAIKLQY